MQGLHWLYSLVVEMLLTDVSNPLIWSQVPNLPRDVIDDVANTHHPTRDARITLTLNARRGDVTRCLTPPYSSEVIFQTVRVTSLMTSHYSSSTTTWCKDNTDFKNLGFLIWNLGKDLKPRYSEVAYQTFRVTSLMTSLSSPSTTWCKDYTDFKNPGSVICNLVRDCPAISHN